MMKENAPTPSWLAYALLTITGPLGFGGLSCWAATEQPSASTHRFELTQGEGTPICNALLDRLKKTAFSKPPYCGIPEDEAGGFETLHRVALTEDEIVTLFTHVRGFTGWQNEDNVAGEDPREFRAFYEGGDTLAWRYEPKVSVNNDGQPDNLIIWQGIGLYEGGISGEGCGGWIDEHPDGGDHPIGRVRPGRQAFVLTANNQSIDQEKTIRLFAHPGALPAPNRFAPIGVEISFLKYRGLYYQEVFYSHQNGDLEGVHKSDPEIDNTLAILLRQGGKTKQVCEYRFVSQKQIARPSYK